MVGRFYEPDDRICIIIDNVDYANLRLLPEFQERFPDDKDWGSFAN